MDTDRKDLPENPDSGNVEDYAGAENSAPRKKRWIIIPILLLLLLCAAGVFFGRAYYMELKKPEEALLNYLDSIKNMDFDKMQSLLQSNDLVALDEAGVKNPAFEDYFRDVNSHLSYKITRSQVSLSDGTASITVHLNYFDGTEIYRQTITEFLRQVVSTAFAGNAMTDSQTEKLLSEILTKTAGGAEEVYAETDIIYPLVKADDVWRVAALDPDTVQVMSANFHSLEEEIQRSIKDAGDNLNNRQGTLPETDSEQEVTIVDEPSSPDKVMDLEGETFSVRYVKHQLSRDFAGKSCLLLYYDYTCTGKEPSSPMADVRVQAFQHGRLLSPAIPENNNSGTENYYKQVLPGDSVSVCQTFSLIDESDVTIESEQTHRSSFYDPRIQILKLTP